MKKKQIITLLALLFTTLGFSQPSGFTAVTGEAKKELHGAIHTASQKIKTLQCNFTQEKSSTLVQDKAISKGVMYYQMPNSLRWEYSSPTPSTLIIHKNSASFIDNKGVVSNNAKMFKHLGDLIMNTINGSSFADEKSFKVNYYINNKQKDAILVVLTPQDKRLKEIFNTIQIKIDKSDYLAKEIVMEEKSGDKTTIILEGKKLNQAIEQGKFLGK